MKYTETKERSAEILRAALALMGQHDAAFNPLSFAVWYEHAAGINRRLSQAIEECLRTEPRLGDETITRLHARHVAAIDEDAVQRASIELARLIASVADSAARTGDQAGRFGETLGGLEAALAAGDVQRLAPVLTRAIENTAVMKDSAAALAHEVASSRQEIERLRQDLSRARDEALFDTLTKVLNRKGFEQRLAAMLASEAPDGTAHALVMVDLDRFKSVNDTYGHMMGDRVLQAVGEVLRRCVVDPAHTVARFGGEEFAILVPASPPDAARALAEHCRETVRALRVRDRRTSGIILSVTISAGVASLRPGEDGSGLIARADKALYAAKAAGRDCVEMG